MTSPAAAGDVNSSWLYLRDGQAIGSKEHPVELIAVGDIMLGRSLRPDAQTLAAVTPWLQAADLAIGNFEGVLAPPGADAAALSTTSPGEPYKLVMPGQTGQLLSAAGFDLLGLANNHALDLGEQGLRRTLADLQTAGLQPFGVSPAPGAPPEPLIVDVKGLRIAFLAFTMIPPPGLAPANPALPTPAQPTPASPNSARSTPAASNSTSAHPAAPNPATPSPAPSSSTYARPTTPNPTPSGPLPARYDSIQSVNSVATARRQADVVVVLMHWGVEYQTFADPAQERVAQELLTAGADLVIGAHPHVVQEFNIHPKGSFISYSLGNFVFDQYENGTANGLALRILLDGDGLRGVQALPIQAGGRPRLLEPDQAQPALAHLQPPDRTIGFTCTTQGCTPAVASPPAGQGVFSSTKIDLTGDGQPETIRLAAGRAEIYQAGTLAWSSPPEWNVLDLAVGDPNNDGRYELLLSIRKSDPAGVVRSHPFIVGYRGGIYKLLWGGSALSTPIGEVELGDVDGDGRQELVVLEDQPDGSHTVGVLHWHGWGFTIAWRSQPGTYEDLALQQISANPPVISVKSTP